jgi:ABC-2 type transport system ATP-binding protein
MMIQVEHLTKYFGPILAVDDVSFEVDKGQIVGFLGLNGAGKTTTMRILTTYLPATSGVAKVAGFDVMNQSMEVRRNIGYLPDNVPLYPEMRVEEYLDFRAKLKGVERKMRTSRLEYTLERCRIREVRRRLLGTLSKGYRQRVGLADAMIGDPRILILDEPTAGLDPEQQDQTLKLIKELGQEHTIIFSTHRLPEVEAICQQVIIIFRGRIRLHRRLKDLEHDAPIVAEVRGPVEQVTNLLKTLDGVSRVTSHKLDDGTHRYDIRTRANQDLREAIGQRIVNNGHGLRRLERRASLHEYFMDLMRERETVPAPAPAPQVSATEKMSEAVVKA